MANPRLLAVVGLALALIATRGDRQGWGKGPKLDGYHRPRPEELFSIELPKDAGPDPHPPIYVDWMPGDPTVTGSWAGARWRVRWSWWAYPAVIWPGTKTWTLRANRDWLIGPLPKPGLIVVYRGRRYRWMQQSLTVEIAQLEPSDSLAAERVLASVRFWPKPPWQ